MRLIEAAVPKFVFGRLNPNWKPSGKADTARTATRVSSLAAYRSGKKGSKEKLAAKKKLLANETPRERRARYLDFSDQVAAAKKAGKKEFGGVPIAKAEGNIKKLLAGIEKKVGAMKARGDQRRAARAKPRLRAKPRESAVPLTERDFSTAERDKAAAKGQALPGGGFPIKSAQDLKNAIQAFGRAKDKSAAKAHIIKRAKALGLTKELPEGWNVRVKEAVADLDYEDEDDQELDDEFEFSTPENVDVVSEAKAGLSALDRLQEVGKVISAANAAKVKILFDSARDLFKLAMGQVDDEDGEPTLDELKDQEKEGERQKLLKKAKAKLGVAATEAARLLEAEFSFDQRRSLVSDALSEAAPAGQRCWILEAYDDYVIYREEDSTTYATTGTYKRAYNFADGTVTLVGDSIPVIEQRTWLPIASSGYSESAYPILGELIPLVEKAVRKDGTAPIKIISSGWGSTGYYPEEVLKRDGPKVFTKGLHMYWDHPTKTEEAERPERSLDTLAGALEADAYWQDNGPKGPGLYADAKVLTPYREAVDELAPHIGTSIRAWGSATYGKAEGKEGPIVESLKMADSVDFVTSPGRGGEVLQLFESARGGRWASAKPRTDPPEPKPHTESEDPKVPDDKDVKPLEEANRRIEEQAKQLARLSEVNLFREARDMSYELVAAADLPDETRKRLVESLPRQAIKAESGELDREKFKEAVEKAIKDEADYLAKVIGPGFNGAVRGVGLSEAADFSDPEKVDGELAKVFGGVGYRLSEDKAKSAGAGRRI